MINHSLIFSFIVKNIVQVLISILKMTWGQGPIHSLKSKLNKLEHIHGLGEWGPIQVGYQTCCLSRVEAPVQKSPCTNRHLTENITFLTKLVDKKFIVCKIFFHYNSFVTSHYFAPYDGCFTP